MVLESMSAPGSALPTPDLSGIETILKTLKKDVDDLQQVTQDFEARSKGQLDSKGRPRIPKIRWRRESAAITAFRDRIKERRMELAEHFRLLLPTQKYDFLSTPSLMISQTY